ncbi:MAG: hypothetical protein ACREPJ_04690 [Rhodanobacteraceae bacterium]
MSAEILLARLEGVRRVGVDSWFARCPAHADKSPSLSIKATADGTVLLHDFAGCDAATVVQAVGLELADLFPTRLKPQTPQERRAAREAFKRSAWCAALRVLSREATVVSCAAGMLLQDTALTPDDGARLTLAMQRIEDARAVLA